MVRNAGTATGKKNAPRDEFPGVTALFEQCVGCKWTLAILHHVRRGVHRPGALERAVAGISTRVLTERLSKLVAFRVLDRVAYPEVPPRVEYRLTAFGERFVGILDQVERLRLDVAE